MFCEYHLSFFLKVKENYDNLRFFSGFKENIKLKILCEYGPWSTVTAQPMFVSGNVCCWELVQMSIDLQHQYQGAVVDKIIIKLNKLTTFLDEYYIPQEFFLSW